MSFSLREELASRLYVDAIAASRATLAKVENLPELSRTCLAYAQDFVDTVCHERGHSFHLQRWLDGHAPTAPGRSSGAPRGIFECSRCGKEEERSGK